jgi:hypothetical protein
MIIEVFEDSRQPGTCRSCGAVIEWATVVKSGRKMPLDRPVKVVSQHGVLFDDGQRVISTIDTAVTKSHFQTCPQAKVWRHR